MTDEQKKRDARTARISLVPSTGHSRELRKRLRKARDDRGLTLEQVAASIAEQLEQEKPFTPGAISHWEAFRRHPPVDVMAAWARAVGMRLMVELTAADSDDVAVPLSPRVAWIARALKGADDEMLSAIETILRRTLPIDPDE